MRLIHITDPHLSTLHGETFMGLRGKRRSGYLSWFKKRRFEYRRDILEQTTSAIKAHHPDQILLTGDLVHIGLEREIVEAAGWLQELGAPEQVMFVPGNHDHYAHDSLAAMYRHWTAYLPPGAPPGDDYTAGFPILRELTDLRLLGVNSACVTPIFSATGMLGDGQRQRLAEALRPDAGDQRFQCLLIHHPPYPGMTIRRKALRDAAQLKELTRKQPPHLTLYGHIHCNREHVDNASRIYCTASASDVHSASYRIFDLQKNAGGWECRMRLMTLDPNGDGGTFSLLAESRWVV